MKKLTLLVLPLFVCLFASAQTIPNANFESWADVNPETWDTPNPETSALIFPFIPFSTVTQETTSPYEGTTSVRLETMDFLGNIVPGALTLGELDINITTLTVELTGGEPFTDTPATFKGYYKYTPAAGDNCFIAALLLKTNEESNVVDTIASAIFEYSSTTPDWTMFEVDFEYLSSETPDTLNIIVASSDVTLANSAAGSVLFVDDFSFEGTTVRNAEVALKNNFNVYPNPVNDVINLDLNFDENVTVKIYNTLGQTLYSSNLTSNNQKINISNYRTGIYLLEVESENEKYFKKIIKK